MVMLRGNVVLKNSFSGSRSKRLADHRSARRRRRDPRSAVSALAAAPQSALALAVAPPGTEGPAAGQAPYRAEGPQGPLLNNNSQG